MINGVVLIFDDLEDMTTEPVEHSNFEEPCIKGESEANCAVQLRLFLKSVVVIDLDLDQVKEQLKTWISNHFIHSCYAYISQ